MKYDISEEINKFNETMSDKISIEYEGDKFIVSIGDECYGWEAYDFLHEQLGIIFSEEKESEKTVEYIIDKKTMDFFDKIWEYNEKCYKEIYQGFMNETEYLEEENELKLNLKRYNEKIINSIKNALNAKTWYMVFDGWAEDMYIIYKL